MSNNIHNCAGCTRLKSNKEIYILPESNCADCSEEIKLAKCKLSCPTCLKLNLPPTYFCCQSCFKSNWSLHKLYHVKPTNNLDLFKNFSFTGKLRPSTMSPQRRSIPEDIKCPDYAISGVPNGEVVANKNPRKIPTHNKSQIEAIRECAKIARGALDLGASMLRPGVTGTEIDDAIHDYIISNGGYPSPLNYYNFPKSVCISVNEVICHGIPDAREIEDGDIVNLDITVYYKDVHCDLNETYFVSNESTATPEMQRLLEGTYLSLYAAIKSIKVGETMYRDIGNVIQKVANRYRLSVVKTYCGHGCGSLFHSSPNVPHYGHNKAIGVVKPGHVFTIEPMLNLGTHRDVTWPDGWTSVTMDGKRSAQFEHMLIIHDGGEVEVVTARGENSVDLGFNIDNIHEKYLEIFGEK